MVAQPATKLTPAEEGAHALLRSLEAAAKNLYDVVRFREGNIDLAIAGKNLWDDPETARIHVRYNPLIEEPHFTYSYSKPPRGLRSLFGDRDTCLTYIVEECQGVPWLTAISGVK